MLYLARHPDWYLGFVDPEVVHNSKVYNYGSFITYSILLPGYILRNDDTSAVQQWHRHRPGYNMPATRIQEDSGVWHLQVFQESWLHYWWSANETGYKSSKISKITTRLIDKKVMINDFRGHPIIAPMHGLKINNRKLSLTDRVRVGGGRPQVINTFVTGVTQVSNQRRKSMVDMVAPLKASLPIY